MLYKLFLITNKLCKAIIIFVICGVSYSLVSDSLISNLNKYSHKYNYHITVLNDKVIIFHCVTTQVPTITDNTIEIYDEINNEVVKYTNFKSIVTKVKSME